MSDSEIVFPDTEAIVDEVTQHPRVAVIDSPMQTAIEASLRSVSPETAPEPPTPTPYFAAPTQAADDVEYDIVMPGGGIETVPAGQLQGTEDVALKAQRRLMQLKMVTALLKRKKRHDKLAEAKPNRIEKSRKKRDMQKASRKKNRGK